MQTLQIESAIYTHEENGTHRKYEINKHETARKLIKTNKSRTNILKPRCQNKKKMENSKNMQYRIYI